VRCSYWPGLASPVPAPIAVNNGTITIAATTPQDQLMFYWAAIGTGTWNAETVAGVNTTTASRSRSGGGG
jgi:hypothetical protein